MNRGRVWNGLPKGGPEDGFLRGGTCAPMRPGNRHPVGMSIAFFRGQEYNDLNNLRKGLFSMEEPIVAQKGPYAVEVKAGQTYYWCACGRSGSQPFCDGSHKGTAFTPMAFTAEKDGTAYLCGCKHTKNPPYCDGTHSSLQE